MLRNTWNREELYEKVWAAPVTKVAKEYGLSDVAIAKACRKLKIPLPGRGYWAKKTHGHPVTKKPLPKLKEEIVVERIGPTVAPASVTPPIHQDDQAEFNRVDERVFQGAFAYEVTPKALRHPLIVTTRSALREGHVDDRKIVSPRFDSEALSVRIGKESVTRALEFFACLIRRSEEHEAKIRVEQTGRYRQTVFVVYGQSVSITISENAHMRYLETPPPQPKGHYVRVLTYRDKPVEYLPTGKLTLEIGGYGAGLRRTWKEGKQSLPDLFPEIMANLFKSALIRRREELNRRAAEEARQRREEELKLLRHRIEEEERRVAGLCQDAENWQRAKTIRMYVLEVMDQKKQQGEDLTPATPLGIWVAWALQQADRIDPLAKSPPSILDRKKELPAQQTDAWRFR